MATRQAAMLLASEGFSEGSELVSMLYSSIYHVGKYCRIWYMALT